MSVELVETARVTESSLLSQKSIPVRERLIFALDVGSIAEAHEMVERLGDSVNFYKLGLQIFLAGNYYGLIEWLRARRKKVFVDLKFFDVPETVQLAVRQLRDKHVEFATVHGNNSMLEAAARVKNGIKILAVTVLTSLDQGDLDDLGFGSQPVQELVLSRARRALQLGCDGVISSGLEAPQLRKDLGNNFLIVSPGIRPVSNMDDQKRTVDVEQAFHNGADYIVVGRPISQFSDPKAKAEEIQGRIAKLFP